MTDTLTPEPTPTFTETVVADIKKEIPVVTKEAFSLSAVVKKFAETHTKTAIAILFFVVGFIFGKLL
jgi:hypothetical protein